MTKEATAILDEGLGKPVMQDEPAPYKGRFPLTDDFIDAAKRGGRE
jgi:hypothetical protein